MRCNSAATKPFPLGRGWGRPRLFVSLTLSSHVGFSAGFMQGLCRIFASNPTQCNVRKFSEIQRKCRVLCRVCRVFLFPIIVECQGVSPNKNCCPMEVWLRQTKLYRTAMKKINSPLVNLCLNIHVPQSSPYKNDVPRTFLFCQSRNFFKRKRQQL